MKKYDKIFDPMREVLIEYATAKDDHGYKNTAPEICRKFGFGTDAKVIDGFNRWLLRNGVVRCPKPRRSELIAETLFPAEEIEPAKPQQQYDPEQPTVEQRLEWIALHSYTAYAQAMAMIQADPEHFKVCRFMSWQNNIIDTTVTATALCDDDWFMAAINCMRDGDMGVQGEDVVRGAAGEDGENLDLPVKRVDVLRNSGEALHDAERQVFKVLYHGCQCFRNIFR